MKKLLSCAFIVLSILSASTVLHAEENDDCLNMEVETEEICIGESVEEEPACGEEDSEIILEGSDITESDVEEILDGETIIDSIEADLPDMKVFDSSYNDDEVEWELTEQGTLIIKGSGTVQLEDSFNEYQDEIKKIIIGSSCTGIGKYCFEDYTNLECVEIEDGLITIGEGAFSNCVNLSSINFPDSIKEIGKSAFWSCKSLEEIVLPDDVTILQEQCFEGCSSLMRVVLPKHLNHISFNAFSLCASLTEIEFPESLEYLENAFADTGIEKIYLPANVKYLVHRLDPYSGNVFIGMEKLKEIEVDPANPYYCICNGDLYTKDKKTLLAHLATKQDIVWAEEIVQIGDEAFARSQMKRLEIPQGVEIIRHRAFVNAEIEYVKLPKSLRLSAVNLFMNCNMKEIEFEEGMTFVDDYTFNKSHGNFYGFLMGQQIKTLTLPESWTVIPMDFAAECKKLTKVTISGDCQEIREGAFFGCINLRDVYYNGTEEDRNNINIERANEPLLEATWHYNYNTVPAVCADGKHSGKTKLVNYKAATCTEEGYSGDVYCASCDAYLKAGEVTAVIPEKHQYETFYTEASCTMAGYTRTECVDCGCVFFHSEIPPTGHSWNDQLLRKEPTETENGMVYQKCDKCEEILVKEILEKEIPEKEILEKEMGDTTEKAEEAEKAEEDDAAAMTVVPSVPLQVKKSVDISKLVSTAADDPIISITSDNEKIVIVDGNRLKAKKNPGTAVITVTTKHCSASFTVNVQKKKVKAGNVSVPYIENNEIYLREGHTFALKPVVTPVTASQKCSFKTSKKKIATVSKKGIITANRAGTATITVKAGSKKTVMKVIVYH